MAVRLCLWDAVIFSHFVSDKLIFLTFNIFCSISYLIAAYNDHLGFILQYVSDSGTYLPSAGFFAEGLDMMAFCREYFFK